MALSEIKTNIQKRETKGEPQTNGSYKISKIIIKIMEYTHMYISISKVKTAQQIQSTADLPSNQSKSKNYIYQLRTKLSQAQAGNQK